MPRGRHERVGGIWSANLVSHTIPVDGSTKAIYGKVIPPGVYADRIYCGLNITGKDNVDIHDEQEIYIHAGMFNLPLNEDKGERSIDVIADTELPLTAQEVFGETFDDDTGDDPDVGITGMTSESDRAKAMKVFSWKRNLKFPDSGVLVATGGEMRFKTRLSLGRSGRHITGYGTDPSIARMIVIRVVTNDGAVYDTDADGDDHAWGGFSSLGDMADQFMKAPQGLMTSHEHPGNIAAGLTNFAGSNSIAQWQRNGWNTNMSGDVSPYQFDTGDKTQLYVSGKVTLYSRITQPKTHNILYSE